MSQCQKWPHIQPRGQGGHTPPLMSVITMGKMLRTTLLLANTAIRVNRAVRALQQLHI